VLHTCQYFAYKVLEGSILTLDFAFLYLLKTPAWQAENLNFSELKLQSFNLSNTQKNSLSSFSFLDALNFVLKVLLEYRHLSHYFYATQNVLNKLTLSFEYQIKLWNFTRTPKTQSQRKNCS
jgi:hypothetical protein